MIPSTLATAESPFSRSISEAASWGERVEESRAAHLSGGREAASTGEQADLQARHLSILPEICFSNAKRDHAFISFHTSMVLRECMATARIQRLQIMSAHRTVEEQAYFMYRNLHHVRPTFRGYGAAVEAVAKSMIGQIQGAMIAGVGTKRVPSVADILRCMVETIEELERRHGRLAISGHREDPRRRAVLDVDVATPARRAELVRVLSACPAISRIGLPRPFQVSAPHEFRALGRWIHIEIPQP